MHGGVNRSPDIRTVTVVSKLTRTAPMVCRSCGAPHASHHLPLDLSKRVLRVKNAAINPSGHPVVILKFHLSFAPSKYLNTNVRSPDLGWDDSSE